VQAALEPALETVRKGTRAVFSSARLLDVDGGTVRFGAPNEPTRARLVKHGDEVAAALADQLGATVRVTVVVDDVGPRPERPTRHAAASAPVAPDEPEEPVDLSELVDAPEVDDGIVSRLTTAFPGAELLEHE
jgi:hypothetical protein